MNHLSFRSIAAAPVIAFLSIFVTGCSMFQSSKQMDMNPFAANTASMFAEAAKVARPANLNLLRPYAGRSNMMAVRAKAEPVIKGLRSIIMYSNQLVALNISPKTEKEKNRLLAQYFRDAEARIADRSRYDSIGVTSVMMDSVYFNITKAETYREGIEAAAPLVNAIVLAMLKRLDEIDSETPAVIAAFDKAIEDDYADKRQNYSDLVRLQTMYQHSATLLYDSRRGDPSAFKALFETDPSLREFFASTDKATPKEFDAAEMALTGRLARIDGFIHQLDNEKAVYVAKQQELENLRVNVDARLKVARDAIQVWAQSHRNLGQGIEVPPMIDVAGISGSLAKKVLPLP